jgi:hypothetical protein
MAVKKCMLRNTYWWRCTELEKVVYGLRSFGLLELEDEKGF